MGRHVPDLGCHRRRRPRRSSGRGVLTRRGVSGRDHSSLRREGSALSAPAAVQGVSQGRNGHPWASLKGRSTLPRPAHRLEARRQRNADRSRCAAGGAQRWRDTRLRTPHPRHRREATAARRAGGRSAGRVRAARHRRRDRDPRTSQRQAQGRDHRRRIHRARNRRDRLKRRGGGDDRRARAPDGPGGLADHVGFFPQRARRASARASASASALRRSRAASARKRSFSPTARR